MQGSTKKVSRLRLPILLQTLHGNVQACVIYLSKAPSYSPYLSKRGPHKGSPSRSGQADPYLLAAKFLTCCSFSPL